MPATISHQLSATTPDDPSYEIQPKHWNSSHAITLNAVGSEISGAFNNAGGVTFGLETNGSITAAAPAGAPSPVNFSAGAASANLASVVFADSNGVSFGLNGSTVTATVKTDYLTTQSVQTQASGDIARSGFTTTATAGTAVVGTLDTGGLKLGVPAYLTTQSVQTQASGDIARSGFTTTATAGTAVVGTHDTAGLKLGVPAYLTTQSVQTQASGDIARSGFTTTATAGTAVVGTHDTAGLKLGVPAYLTTQTVQTQASGDIARSGFTTTATAGTAVVGTHDTAGLKLGVPAYLTTQTVQTQASGGIAGTASGFSGANVSGSMTLNTAGLSLSLSVAAPGAAAENNWVNLLGANTAGNTTASGSTIGWSGQNLTLSGTNDSQIVISAPATSSLQATQGIGISTNGSTITVSETPMSNWIVPQDGVTFAAAVQANSHVSVFPFYVPRALAFSQVKIVGSFSYASAANTSSASQAYSASIVLYTRNASTLSSVWSGKQNSNSFFQSNSTTQLAGARGINVTGAATTIPPDLYWAAVHLSTASTGTGGATTALGASVSMLVAVSQATAGMQADNWNGGATNQSNALFLGQGIYSTGATLQSIAFNDAALTQSGTKATNAECILNFQNWTVF